MLSISSSVGSPSPCVGWDDIEDCQYSRPTLTSIAPEKADIARIAMEQLVAGTAGRDLGACSEITPGFKLAVRESTIGRSVLASP